MESTVLEEVIVTARKRGDENVQDIAMSAAVVSSDLIDLKQLVGMDDYLRTVPSVTYQNSGPGRSTMIIRGISADPMFSYATAAVYVNETPVTGLGFIGTSSPDLKLVDVSRIEILRGPQGTLYGSGSLGGTVRIITEPPRTDAFGGSVEGSWSSTAELGGSNYDLQGAVNIPLAEDVFAIRAVAYRFDNSGYYRNVAGSDPEKTASATQFGALAKNWDDMGNSTYTGGRITALWTPTDRLSFNLMFLDQEIDQEGRGIGDLARDAYDHARYSRVSTGRPEAMEDELRMVSLLIQYDFDAFDLVSSSSWTDYDSIDDQDFGQYVIPIFGADLPNFLADITKSEQFVQEIRLVSHWDSPVQFLAGLYYEDLERSLVEQLDWEGDPAQDPFGGALWLYTKQVDPLKQKAFFGEVSWGFTDSLSITGGARLFDYDRDYILQGDGVILGGPASDATSANENGETWKVNLTYRPTDDALYYAQWSQGFRLGFPTGTTPATCDLDGDGLIDGLGLPAAEQVNSDTLDSYEAGGKISFGGNRANLRVAVYRNNWDEIPITLFGDCGFSFTFNAGEARTSGVELEGGVQLSDRWRLDFSAGYLKGELTKDTPGLGSDGDRLPGSPEFTATLGLQYDFPYESEDGYVRADLATVGGFYNNLQEQGAEIGDYTTLNLASGLSWGRFDFQVFITNATNSDAATWIDQRPEFPSAYRLRPRTTGVSLRYTFGE